MHIARCENFLFEERYILEKTIGNRVTVTAGERIEITIGSCWNRALGTSENPGGWGASSIVVDITCTLVRIGLTNLPNLLL